MAKTSTATVAALNKLLADSYTLYLKTHNYHWNVTGPMFTTLHTLFMTQYTELSLAVDQIAERIRALGSFAPGSYSDPATNPFVGMAGAQGEVWDYGLRNPWRFSFDRMTGDLWIGDVGQNAYEEISYLPAGSPGGANFGWNLMEGTHPFPPGSQPPSASRGPGSSRTTRPRSWASTRSSAANGGCPECRYSRVARPGA